MLRLPILNIAKSSLHLGDQSYKYILHWSIFCIFTIISLLQKIKLSEQFVNYCSLNIRLLKRQNQGYTNQKFTDQLYFCKKCGYSNWDFLRCQHFLQQGKQWWNILRYLYSNLSLLALVVVGKGSQEPNRPFVNCYRDNKLGGQQW